MAAAAVVVLLAGIAVAVVPMYLRHMIRKSMSVDDRQACERAVSEPVSLPDSWCRADPADPQVLSATLAIARCWQAVQPLRDPAVSQVLNDSHGAGHTTPSLYSKLQQRQALSHEEWTSVSSALAHVACFLEETSHSANCSGYDAGAYGATFNLSGYDGGFLALQIAARLQLLRAHEQAHAQNWPEAFASAQNAFELARRHEASSLITHLIAVALVSHATHTMAVLAEQCPDAALAERHLQAMNRLDPLVNLNILGQGDLLDCIAVLRSAKAAGYPLTIESGKTAMHYQLQALEVKVRFAETMLQRLSPTDPRRAVLLSQTAGRPREFSVPGGELGLQLVGVFLPELIFRLAHSNVLEYAVREKVAKANFDLARLALAARLRKLRSGETSATLGALMPAYLPQAPADPFSDKEYLQDASSGEFYSVGPDKRDERMRVTYDPTNGTVSAGDVALP